MGLFVRRSNGPSNKQGEIVCYIDDDGFVRRSNAPCDKYGDIVYYVGADGFVRRSNGPSNKQGDIVYYVGADGFVRKSNGPSNKQGDIVYYVDADGFVRKSNAPCDKYGEIVYYAGKDRNEKEQQSQEPSEDQKKGALLIIGLILALIFAPILIVLGMFGKFLLGGLFENVLPLEAFKKFRKTYSVINIVWLTLGIAAIVVLAILEINVSIPLFTLVGGNILLFVLSIVFGNKIYKEHKHELPQPVEEFTETEDDTATSEEAFAEEPFEQIEFAPDTTNSVQNNLAAIKQLKELLDMGAITQKEFEDKKQMLLGEAFVPQQPNAQAGSNNQAVASTEALIKRAYAFLQSKETRKARGYFEKALDIEPNNSEALTGTLLLELGLTSLKELEEGTLFFNKSKAYARINSLCSDLSYYENALEKIKENNYKLLNQAKEAKDYSAIIKYASNLLTYEKEKEKLAILVFLAKFKADSVADLEKMQVDYGKSSEYKELTAYLSKENKELFESTIKAIKNKKKKKVIIIISAIAAVLLIIGIVLAVYFTSNEYYYLTTPDGNGGVIITGYRGDKTELVIPSKIGGKPVTTIKYRAFYNRRSLKSITIPNSVTTIGEDAFLYCRSLKSITIPNSVTTIGRDAFRDCDSLTIYCEAESKPEGWSSSWNNSNRPVVWGCTGAFDTTEDGFKWAENKSGINIYDYTGNATTLEIPSEINGKPVTTIGYRAFYYCNSLKSIVIPNSVTAIGSSAFYSCDSLTSIVIPDSVTTIGSSAFEGCSSLTSVVIPNSVTTIGSSAFEDCSSLTSIVIPNSVITIGNSAFSSCDSLTSVVIPNSVTTIEKYAFSYCTSLESVVIPNSVTTIGNYAFYYCSSLESVVIPNSVTTIGNSAFSDCSSLTSIVIPSSVTTIGEYAFSDCSSLTSVVIPNSVTTIGERAFYNCKSLTIYCEIEESEKPEGWNSSWNSYGSLNYCPVVWGRCITEDGFVWKETTNGVIIFGYKGGKTDIEIPSEINGKPVTTIGEKAFYDCDSITSVVIPNSVTTIGEKAFYDCDSITSVVIPNSVTTIGDYAFYYCDSLKSVVIPNSVTTIGEKAFAGCISLTIYCEREESEKPEGWDSYWNYSDRPVVWGFTGNTGSTEDGLSYGETENEITISGYTGNATTLEIPSEINGKPVTAIGEKAFYNCDTITSIVIPSSVTTIGKYAFYSCSSLTSIVIPNSVTTIGEYAFSSCGSLAIYCEAESKPAGWSSSWNNSNRPVAWGYTGGAFGKTDGGCLWVETQNGITVFGHTGNATTLEIPSEINGKPVTAIEEKAFENRDSLKSVVILGGVTTIGDYAFYDCDSLESVVIPNSVTTIGEYAFYSCDSLTIYCGAESKPEGWNSSWNNSNRPVVWIDGLEWAETANSITITDYVGVKKDIEIPSKINGKPVTAIGNSAFYSCRSLESVVIPNSVTTIGSSAFYYCTSLKSIVIPNSVTTIGDYAFRDCYSLESVVILEGVTTIGNSAFYSCDSLESVVIPNSVTTIGEYAFEDCYSLKNIVIPNSVTKIGRYAFYCCYSLTSIVIPNSVTTIGTRAFYNCSSITIYCEIEESEKPEGWDENWNDGRPVVWGKSITEDGFVWKETTNGVIITDYKGGKTDIEIPSEINGKPVTAIGEEAFFNRYSLKSVVIPSSVTTIGSFAFYGCSSLTIYCEIEESEKPEGWDSSWNNSGRPVVWGHSHTFTNGSCVCGTKEN